MIKRSLKILTSFIVGLALIGCTACSTPTKVTVLQVDPTEEELATLYKQELKAGEKWGTVGIENRSDCLMTAVTILEVVTLGDGVEAMELVHGGWYDVGDTDSVELIIGRKYIILVEAFRGNQKMGQEMKVGELVDAPNNDVIVHCIHTEPKDV